MFQPSLRDGVSDPSEIPALEGRAKFKPPLRGEGLFPKLVTFAAKPFHAITFDFEFSFAACLNASTTPRFSCFSREGEGGQRARANVFSISSWL